MDFADILDLLKISGQGLVVSGQWVLGVRQLRELATGH